MQHITRIRRLAAAATAVVVATTLVAAQPAAAAADPVFTGGQGVAPYADNSQSAMASGAGKVLVVWRQKAGSSYDVYGRFTAPDTTSVEPQFRISKRALAEESPDVAWNGSRFLVVWTQTVAGGTTDVRGQRVTQDGALDGTELAISNGPDSQFEPATAAGANGQFLVVWQDFRNIDTLQGDVYAGRVSSTGSLPDGAGRRLSKDVQGPSSNEATPDVAWNGSVYLVVFAQYGPRYRVWSVAVRPDMTKAHDGEIAQTVAGVSPRLPAVASDGANFLVVFGYGFDDSPDSFNILGVAVNVNGGYALGTFVIADGSWGESAPAIAFNGTYVVAWVDRRKGKNDIWGTQIRGLSDIEYEDGFLITEYYPENGQPALSKATGSVGTFTVSWTSRPSGLQDGVVAYGLHAPK